MLGPFGEHADYCLNCIFGVQGLGFESVFRQGEQGPDTRISALGA